MAEIRVLEEIRAATGDQRKSAQWYQNQVRQLVGTVYSGQKLMSDYSDNLTNRLLPGRMYLINYMNPITKAKLPYYDQFPLILPFNFEGNLISALNFHYLHPVQRIILLEKLSRFNTKDSRSQTVDSRIYQMWTIDGMGENTKGDGIRIAGSKSRITNKKYFDEMINPRLAALAEIAWCSEAKRSWANFRSSLKNNLEYLSKIGWKFHNF